MDTVEIEGTSILPQLPKLKQHIKLTSTLCVIYLSLLLGALSAILLIPSSPASSQAYTYIYNTHYFEPSKIFYFFLLMFTGQIYVKSVVLKNYLRATGRSFESKADMAIFFTITLFAFVLGGNATLVAYNDNVSFIDALIYNYCGYTIPYVLFLNITYVISGVLIKVEMPRYERWKLQWKSIIIVMLIFCFIIGMLCYQIYLLNIYGRLSFYFFVYVCIFMGAIVYNVTCHNYRVNKTFFISFILLLLTTTPSITSAIIQAALLGIITEAVVRVGFKNLIELY